MKAGGGQVTVANKGKVVACTPTQPQKESYGPFLGRFPDLGFITDEGNDFSGRPGREGTLFKGGGWSSDVTSWFSRGQHRMRQCRITNVHKGIYNKRTSLAKGRVLHVTKPS